MKTLRKMKKGFTIVELVIVIAVIAVLTAILVPTFISISNKANEASDKSLVKNLNTALRMAEGDQGKKNETMFDAVEDVKEYAGIMLPQFVSKSGDEILWDSVTDEFVWKTAKPQGRADVLLWTIVDSYKSGDTQTYSMFAGSKWSSEATSVTGLTVGFDVGYHSEITTVSYTRADDATTQTATIRTNSDEAVVTITAKSDIVKHYGLAKKVNVVKTNLDHSFHSNGKIGFAQVAYGHFVADAGKVYGLYASTDDTKIDENGGVIVAAYKADGVNKNGNKDFTEIPSGKTIEDIEEEAEGELIPPPETPDHVFTEEDLKAIEKDNAIIKINDTYYSSVSDAFEDISDPDEPAFKIPNGTTHIKLLSNVKIPGTLVGFSKVDTYIDLNGFNFIVYKGFGVFVMWGEPQRSQITISNSGTERTGGVLSFSTQEAASTYLGVDAIFYLNGADITINGGVIDATGVKGDIFGSSYNNVDVVMNGGTLIADSGYSIFGQGIRNITLNGGTLDATAEESTIFGFKQSAKAVDYSNATIVSGSTIYKPE